MVTLDEMYRNADLHLIEVMHPNWQFYRNDRGFLCCRIKKQIKKEQQDDIQRRSCSPPQ